MARTQVVQGKAASDIEYRVSVSLTKYNWDFEFQVQVMGGRRRRGGQVIDFMVQTLPNPTPLYVQGDYYHGSRQADRDKLAQRMLTSIMDGSINQPIIVYGNELETQEESDDTILKLFGRNN